MSLSSTNPTALLQNSTTAARRLDNLLSQTSTLDTTLLTASYTLHFLNALLTRLPLSSTLTPSSPSISPSATSPFSLLPTLPLLRLQSSLPPLTSLFDETRTVLRLWGLLSVYTSAIKTYTSPPKDPIIRLTAIAQITSLAIFQALENGAFLATRNIVAWKKETVVKAYKWSSRAWMVYTLLDLMKLAREYQSRKIGRAAAASAKAKEKADGASKGDEMVGDSVVVLPSMDTASSDTRPYDAQQDGQRAWQKQWKKNVLVNLAYAPMTVHYSFGSGFLGEGGLSLLGLVVAYLSMGDAWAKTA